MNAEPLTAVILGAGFAAEGHTVALQHAGVQVVGMTSRTESTGRSNAKRLGIPEYDTDWKKILNQLKPDIVALATPGGTHRVMGDVALRMGCHVLSDKPLATCAKDARYLYELALSRNLKTAYAASYRYQPQAYLAHRLVASGVLGKVCEAEFVSHYHWPSLMPYGWPHRLEDGGGRLNNNFTHKLAIAQHIFGGSPIHAIGNCRNDLKRAPLGHRIHDFRNYFKETVNQQDADRGEWGEVTSDWSYTVLVDMSCEKNSKDPVSITFRHSGLRFSKHADYVALYGDKGVLHIEGAYVQGDVQLSHDGQTWETLAIPEEIEAALTPEDDTTQRNWNQLAVEFVNDIQGKTVPDYLTFHDGWIYQEIIDHVRARKDWTAQDH